MAVEPRSTVQKDMCARNVRAGGAGQEKRKTRDIRGVSVSASRLILAHRLIASGVETERGHLTWEETRTDGVHGDVAGNKLDG